MERNSRDIPERMDTINSNAEAVCEYLHTCTPLVKHVYYPKWETPANYEACRVAGTRGYGGLFSVLFNSEEAARAFYDALPCCKGPSLGTAFTLSCAYALLAHFHELEWAAGHGVGVDLVRVSVGTEDREMLLEAFKAAIAAAENC